MSKDALESLLLHLISQIKIIKPADVSEKDMVKEIKSDLILEWKEFRKKYK